MNKRYGISIAALLLCVFSGLCSKALGQAGQEITLSRIVELGVAAAWLYWGMELVIVPEGSMLLWIEEKIFGRDTSGLGGYYRVFGLFMCLIGFAFAWSSLNGVLNAAK